MMHDWPRAAGILTAVAEALRADAPLSAFDRRVAASALDIARRELEQHPAAARSARDRLSRILGRTDGDPERVLARRIRTGEIGEETPGLLDHLWRTTLAKVAVDQPGFPLYRRLTEGESRR